MKLEARNLTIGYPDHTVGSGLDVALNTGEVLALLGPNGGGKTTLLKTLLGLLKRKAGEITLGGKPFDNYSIPERARVVAYVPQVHVGTFAYTVETVVLMGRTAHGNLFSRPSAHDRDVAHGALERFGIGRLSERPWRKSARWRNPATACCSPRMIPTTRYAPPTAHTYCAKARVSPRGRSATCSIASGSRRSIARR
jgi:ABC-type cobalamin/Fe3+-siderophores transport system ATPase subunit